MGIPALLDTQGMPDLAPTIYRQRLVIEGTCDAPVTDTAIGAYCKAFDEEAAVEYTGRALGATRLVSKAF